MLACLRRSGEGGSDAHERRTCARYLPTVTPASAYTTTATPPPAYALAGHAYAPDRQTRTRHTPEVEAGAGVQDYGFRLYSPAMGRFLSTDPLTRNYPWYTPYQFAGNMPISAVDMDGLEPRVVNGVVIGYDVLPGQGPTQIAADLNSPETQARYGYALFNPVSWRQIIDDQQNDVRYFDHIQQGRYDTRNQSYTELNMNAGDFIQLPSLGTDPYNSADRADFSGNDASVVMEVKRMIKRSTLSNSTLRTDDIHSAPVDPFSNSTGTGRRSSRLGSRFSTDESSFIFGSSNGEAKGLVNGGRYDMQITLYENIPGLRVGQAGTGIFGHVGRTEVKQSELETFGPYAYTVVIAVAAGEHGRNSPHRPTAMSIGFRTAEERDKFLGEALQLDDSPGEGQNRY